MIRDHFLIFDQFMPAYWPAVTSASRRLAKYDLIAIAAVGEQLSGVGTITVRYYHTSDGHNWELKDTPIDAVTIGPLAPAVFGFDAGAYASLDVAYLEIFIEGAVSGRIKVYVTMRDDW